MRRTRADIVLLGLCALSLLFLYRGWRGKPTGLHAFHATAVPPVDPAAAAISGNGFAPDAAYALTQKPAYRGSLKFWGSWLGSDESTGSAESQWYRFVPDTYIFVAGYPNHAGNQLFADVAYADGRIVRIPLSPERDPGEFWAPKLLPFAGAGTPSKFRIIAVDNNKVTDGWLGFSQPFVMPVRDSVTIGRELVLALLGLATAIVAFVAPGLMLLEFLRRRRRTSFVWVPLPGLLLLGLIGIACWVGPEWMDGPTTARISLAVLVLVAVYRFVRVPLGTYTHPADRRALAVAAVLALICAGKASYSVWPEGELFANTTSRTLEVGGVSDSRLPYHAIQLIAAKADPFGPLAKSLYRTYGVWNFSHRGALAPLAEAPIVLAGPVLVPPTMPDQPWTVFDAQGFALFRIAAIVLACTALLFVFGVSRLFLTDDWALLSFLIIASAPFIVHDIYFTWPKIEAACFAVLGGYLVFRKRFFAAGLAIGAGYLCHPSALLSNPVLFGIILLTSPPYRAHMPFLRRARGWILAGVQLLAGLAIAVLIWKGVTGPHFGQGEFLSYAMLAGRDVPTPLNWILHRVDSLLDTLVPFYTFFAHKNDPDMSSTYGPTPLIMPFFLQYWRSIPFGAGLVLFPWLVRIWWTASKRARAWVLLVFCFPLVFFATYFGAVDTGLLREGLHAWFIAFMIFSVVIWRQYETHSQRLWRLCSFAILSRAIELPAMMLLPAIVSQHAFWQPLFAFTDVLSLAIVLGGCASLGVYGYRLSEQLRRQSATSRTV